MNNNNKVYLPTNWKGTTTNHWFLQIQWVWLEKWWVLCRQNIFPSQRLIQ